MVSTSRFVMHFAESSTLPLVHSTSGSFPLDNKPMGIFIFRFVLSYTMGIFPDIWELALVQPIGIRSKSSIVSSYRPILSSHGNSNKPSTEHQTFWVVLHGFRSTPQRINAEVPQGSVLSLKLFLIFINDLLSDTRNPIHFLAQKLNQLKSSEGKWVSWIWHWHNLKMEL